MCRDQPFDGRRHFFGAAAEAIRRLLVEQARRRQAVKRGGGRRREEVRADQIADPAPDDELRAVHDALDRLAQGRTEKAELVELRYFGGLGAE